MDLSQNGTGRNIGLSMKIKRETSKDPLIANLIARKDVSRGYLRSLSPAEKIEKMLRIQFQYYQLLQAREQSGGKPIPPSWQKWYRARKAYSESVAESK